MLFLVIKYIVRAVVTGLFFKQREKKQVERDRERDTCVSKQNKLCELIQDPIMLP